MWYNPMNSVTFFLRPPIRNLLYMLAKKVLTLQISYFVYSRQISTLLEQIFDALDQIF